MAKTPYKWVVAQGRGDDLSWETGSSSKTASGVTCLGRVPPNAIYMYLGEKGRRHSVASQDNRAGRFYDLRSLLVEVTESGQWRSHKVLLRERTARLRTDRGLFGRFDDERRVSAAGHPAPSRDSAGSALMSHKAASTGGHPEVDAGAHLIYLVAPGCVSLLKMLARSGELVGWERLGVHSVLVLGGIPDGDASAWMAQGYGKQTSSPARGAPAISPHTWS